MANFFTSPGDLIEWVKEAGSAKRAAEILMSLPSVGGNNYQDIVETTKRIFSQKDVVNASETLFSILTPYGITETGVKEAEIAVDNVKVADDLLRNNVITADEHGTMIKTAQIMRQPGEYMMPLRVCPKLPWSVGKKLISTYNCRHYCLDSEVFDDDPERVYCAEALWRRHVADKFSHEWKDRKTGKWVGGYINDRFFSYRDDGGNQMELRPDERTRKPRAHQWSTERRLMEQREPGSGIDLTAEITGKMVKKASSMGKDEDAIYAMFSEAVNMRNGGIPNDEALLKLSEKFSITMDRAVKVQSLALRKMASHQADVYTVTAQVDEEKKRSPIPTPRIKVPSAKAKPATSDQDIVETAKEVGLI